MTLQISITEHEREKSRLQAQIDALVEQHKISESALSEVKIEKVELVSVLSKALATISPQNKRIKELEKRQSPLMDTNRRLTDRNRHLMLELRRIEQTARETMDSYLSLVRCVWERQNELLFHKSGTREKQRASA